MGRVARYKKVKAFDPYSKQNGHGRRMMSLEKVGVWGLGDNGRKAKKRSLTAQKLMAQKLKHRKNKKGDKNTYDEGKYDFDIPPEPGDDFDLNDLVGSLKPQTCVVPEEEEQDSKKEQATAGDSQQLSRLPVTVNEKLQTEAMSPNNTKKEPSDLKQEQLSSSLKATLPETDAEEHRVAKLLNLEQQLATSQKKQQQKQQMDNMNRLPGESKNAYRRRVAMETRQIIKRETQQARNPEKRQRKKEFLTAKKKRKKGGGSGSFSDGGGTNTNNGDEDLGNDDDDDVLCTGEQAYAARASHVPAFGEQAERPPTFRQLPRGADKNMNRSSHTLLADGLVANPKVVLSTMAAQMLSSSRSSDHQDAPQTEREQAVELARRKAQAQYAMLKAKRKKAGEFHL